MKAKYTLWLNNTITHNPISARRVWFWHVASHIYNECITFTIIHVKYPIYIYRYFKYLFTYSCYINGL